MRQAVLPNWCAIAEFIVSIGEMFFFVCGIMTPREEVRDDSSMGEERKTYP